MSIRVILNSFSLQSPYKERSKIDQSSLEASKGELWVCELFHNSPPVFIGEVW